MQPVPSRLKEHLEANHVRYEVHPHAEAFTALEVARADHVPASEMAKVVMLRSGDEFLMAVLPAPYKVDLTRLRRSARRPELHLATESEFTHLFPECEAGAMPPFGNLFGLPVWVDEPLARQDEIVFNAGTHSQTVHMAYADFERLVHPQVASFGKA